MQFFQHGLGDSTFRPFKWGPKTPIEILAIWYASMREKGFGQCCANGPNKTQNINVWLVTSSNPAVKCLHTRGFIAVQ
jgi:hypothetical protein